jgi:protein-S-isoprenylcysteine O-methyltransferase Ste14
MSRSLIDHKPPRIAMLLLVAATALHWLTPLGERPASPSIGFAAMLGVAGFTIMTWGWWQFRARKVAICPTAETTQLITDGVFRLTRNPMYLGILLMLTAIAVSVGTVPFAAAAAGFFLVINAVFCPYEETKLEATFRDAYVRYRSRVRRWI